jgi:hypothetical protein
MIFVAFAARGFDIEHQVLHVEPELAQGVLDKREDTAAAFGALDDAFKGGDHVTGILVRQGMDSRNEAEQVGRQFFDGRRGNSWCVGHRLHLWVGSAGAKMHTPRHPGRTSELAAGLTDYMETTCIHSTNWRRELGQRLPMMRARNE